MFAFTRASARAPGNLAGEIFVGAGAILSRMSCIGILYYLTRYLLRIILVDNFWSWEISIWIQYHFGASFQSNENRTEFSESYEFGEGQILHVRMYSDSAAAAARAHTVRYAPSMPAWLEWPDLIRRPVISGTHSEKIGVLRQSESELRIRRKFNTDSFWFPIIH